MEWIVVSGAEVVAMVGNLWSPTLPGYQAGIHVKVKKSGIGETFP